MLIIGNCFTLSDIGVWDKIASKRLNAFHSMQVENLISLYSISFATAGWINLRQCVFKVNFTIFTFVLPT